MIERVHGHPLLEVGAASARLAPLTFAATKVNWTECEPARTLGAMTAQHDIVDDFARVAATTRFEDLSGFLLRLPCFGLLELVLLSNVLDVGLGDCQAIPLLAHIFFLRVGSQGLAIEFHRLRKQGKHVLDVLRSGVLGVRRRFSRDSDIKRPICAILLQIARGPGVPSGNAHGGLDVAACGCHSHRLRPPRRVGTSQDTVPEPQVVHPRE